VRHCSEHLAAYKIPRVVEFRDEIPRSATGKILRGKLIAEPSGGT
jgi:long-chain acyl-CoA synthetase